jgi:uncharacterized protein (TIGR02246 family)
MRTIWLLAVLVFVAAAVRAEVPAARRGDAEAIRQLYTRYDAAWNKGDTAGLALIWAYDADHVAPDGRAVNGRTAIAKELGQRLATDLKGSRSQQTISGIRFITPDVAVVDATYQVSSARDAQGKSLPPLQGRYVDIWLKRAGKWHIIADRPIVFTPPAK